MDKLAKISSRDNRRLVRVRSIRDGKEAAELFVEGRRLVAEALRSQLDIEECFVVERFADRQLLEAVALRTGLIAELPAKIFGTIADTNQPQGIIVVAKRPSGSQTEIESRLKSARLPLTVFLKEVNNPSNLGAILRTVEAADAAGVIVSTNSADVFSPKALRAAMGASFRIPIWQYARFDEVLHWAKIKNLTTTAADISGSRSYTQVDWNQPRLLIFGSEARGLDKSELELLGETIRIPMENNVESLNLAVSAGIILFEAKRQSS